MKPCKRMKVTAIGYSSSLESFHIATNGNRKECTEEPGNCGCTHAEDRLLQHMPNPSYVILSHSPCFKCATLLHEAGVKTVIYEKQYRKTEGISYLVSKGIQVIQLGGSHD
jgi:deoxycytidylate deaminase